MSSSSGFGRSLRQSIMQKPDISFSKGFRTSLRRSRKKCESEMTDAFTLCIKVIGARIDKKASASAPWQYGTFAKVFSIENGAKTFISKTETDASGKAEPSWDFICHSVPYTGTKSGEKVEIGVYCDGKNNNSSDNYFCGSAKASIDDLLGDEIEPALVKKGPIRELDLVREEQQGKKMKTIKTGIITVKAVLVAKFTKADKDMFVLPVHRIGVSGGTAPFFELKLKNPSGSYNSVNYFIGKDLEHAMDEIFFYEDMVSFKKQYADNNSETSFLLQLLSFAFDYAGVLIAPEAGTSLDEPPRRQLLVLRNLKDNCTKLRLLDLKIGHFTASAGWQGKTKARAKKQQAFDRITNSRTEGFRLEGFDGKPKALSSKDPSIFHATIKKADKVMLQTLTGEEIFMHFLDTHRVQSDNHDINNVYSSTEFAELVMHEIAKRLTHLAVLCHKVTFPQKWVGSSVALGYDCGLLPPRSTNEEDIRSNVIVNIFDWGRSELNTPSKEQSLTDEQRLDRKKYWDYYVSGIDRLSFAAAQIYRNRFGNSQTWKEIIFTLYDYDTLTDDDCLGKVTVPVQETPLTECKLQGNKGTLFYSIKWHSLPSVSRLKGSWRIFVHRAEDLCNKDIGSLSDPYCLLTAVSEDDKFCFRQETSTVKDDLNPTWNETLYLPVTATPDALECVFECHGIKLESDTWHQSTRDKAMWNDWSKTLSKASFPSSD